MKGEIKGFGRLSKNNHTDARDRCGKLVLQAQDEQDAALLALLGRVLFDVLVNGVGHRERLYRWMRAQVADKQNFPGKYDYKTVGFAKPGRKAGDR